MRNGRMLTRWRTAVLAAVAVLGLGACEGDATRSSELVGRWEARLEGTGSHQTHRLEITPTTYVWIQESYGPGGRPEDSLQDRFTHSGEWKMMGDRLAMRAGAMQHWFHPVGEGVVDFAPRWDHNNRIASLRDDRMTISYEPPPEQSYARPTLHFERVR